MTFVYLKAFRNHDADCKNVVNRDENYCLKFFRFACLHRKHLNGKLKLDVYVGVLKNKTRMGIGGGKTERDGGRKRRNENREGSEMGQAE